MLVVGGREYKIGRVRVEAPKLAPERTREVVRLRIWREWVVVSIFF